MKKETKNNLIIVSLLLLVIVSGLLGGMIGYNRAKAKCQTQTGTVSDTTWFTLTEEIPVPSPPDTVTKFVTKEVLVPLADVEIDTDVDSARVTLPFEQHHATLEDVAEVWYSGYQTKIDSAVVYRHVVTEIIKQPYEVTVAKEPVLTLDVGIGNHQWQTLDPYVFAKATIKADRWKIEPYAGYSYTRQPMFGVSVSYSMVLIR